MYATRAPYPQFTDNNGQPLEAGYIYYGVAGKNPETNPITVYWDKAGSQPVAQPVRTSNGYAVRAGTPADIYTQSDYSISVKDKNSNLVYYKGSAVESISQYLPAINVKDAAFGAVGDGVTDDTAALQAAVNAAVAAGGGLVYFPIGNYLNTGTLTVNGNGVVLAGQSTTGSKITFNNGANDSIYLYGPSSSGIYNCQIRDLSLEHGTKTGGAAIKAYRANQCQIARVNINNPWNGFDFKTINNLIVSETVVASVHGSFGCKFYSLATGTERSDVLTMRDTGFDMSPGGGDGIVWDGFAHTMRLFGVGVLNANRGLLVQNTAGSGSYYPAFGEFFDLEIVGTTGTAARLEAGAVMAFNGCELFNLATATGPVLEILGDTSGSYTNGIRITGGRIFGGAKECIVMGGRNFTMGGGAQIGGGSTTGYSCIRIANGAQDFLIADTSIGTTWGAYISKYDYGITIEATTYRGLVDDVSFYGCNNEVNNLSTTNTVAVSKYLNRNGIPNEGPFILRRSDNNTGIFEDKIYNPSTGPNVTAQRALSVGTPGADVIEALKDNSGSPFYQFAGSSVVSKHYLDFNQQFFRNYAGVQMFAIGSTLVGAADDAGAAAAGVPLYGYYHTYGFVCQRLV